MTERFKVYIIIENVEADSMEQAEALIKDEIEESDFALTTDWDVFVVGIVAE